MNIQSTRPRRARIALIGVAAAMFSIVALPGTAGAEYPPQAPPRSISVEALTTTCVDGAPILVYRVTPNGFASNEIANLTATVTVFDAAGNKVAGPTAGKPLADQVPYPANAPGSGLRVQFIVADLPAATAAVQYPAESLACLSSSPPGQSPPAIDSPQAVAPAGAGTLPTTGGSDTVRTLWIALGALVAGGLILAASSRRHGALTIDD